MPLYDPNSKKTYKDFNECVKVNSWADNPEAYCSTLKEKPSVKAVLQEPALKALIDDIIQKIKQIFTLKISRDIIKKTLTGMFDKGLENAEEQFNMNFVRNPRKIDFLSDYTFDNIKGMNDEIAEKLRKEISQGLINLESPTQIKERVKDVMDVAENRAMMIARTESNRALNQGHLEGAKQSGLKLKKVWSAHLDSRTSPICKALDGKRVGMNEKFKYQGEELDAPPAHVNCRSRLIFVQE